MSAYQVRAKFRVDSIQINEQSVYDRAKRENITKQVATVRLSPVTGGSKENEEFYEATPGGQIVLAVLNMEAATLFEQGKQIFVDFSKAD